MLYPPLTIAPGPGFWAAAARELLAAFPELQPEARAPGAGIDLSGLRIVVPTFYQGHRLRAALATALGCGFIAPRICTLDAWIGLQPPDDGTARPIHAGGNERLIALYAELRQHAWLKKLFAARRNTDLLPLAHTLLALADELTAALLPAMASHPEDAEARWDAALSQLPPSARSVLSDESHLVWTIWKSQLDADDPTAARFARMMRLAAGARTPLVWIAPAAPDPCAAAFLQAWGERQAVLPILLDWRAAGLSPALAQAWPEIVDAEPARMAADGATGATGVAPALASTDACSADRGHAEPDRALLTGLRLSPATSLEDEATGGAQTIIDWLRQGKSAVAIVAQDRVVARRIRALLQRAHVEVADETGWKLSTTRAAAALAAWFDMVTSRAESTALLDFLKSPFLLDASENMADQVMAIEIALRRANVAGGWRSIAAAVPAGPARAQVQQLAALAATMKDRHTIADWLRLTDAALNTCGIKAAYAADAAGVQVLAMLEAVGEACAPLVQTFSFAEWRAYVSLQLESTAFLPPMADRRVVMLPLNGTHMRSFDAVLVVGADASHLPSVSSETLFFANAVRRELGLTTRESRQLQQLRDFAELLAFNSNVVLSWQAHRDGEPNPVSNWVARLALHLARTAQASLVRHRADLASVRMQPVPAAMPAPAAAQLLPRKLSASGYASLVACPYQFFATRMLSLSGLDDISGQLEKRDYGDWLHQILHLYHVTLRDAGVALSAREALLLRITQQVFDIELAKSGAALGYLDRWQKAMPAYLAWANAREASGWTFVSGEEWREQALRWSGGELQLHGRIDRIDRHADGDVAVLDYKTSSMSTLKKRLEGHEDHQLAFYGLLSEAPPEQARYVALDPVRDKIDDIGPPDYAHRLDLLRQQIGGTMQAIAAGAALRASGIESVCQYCDVRGLCRKGAW